MPLPDLLLGTRRLQRDIKVQSQQFEHDMARVKLTGAQLRHTAVARVTSPIGLLGAAGIGFLAGSIRRSPSKSKPVADHHHHINDIVAFTLHTARSIGLQILLPIAAGWLQSKFDNDKSEDNFSNGDNSNAT